ncbi:hypothetical protein LJB89_01865, partial [Tyzzerella sp. OttesenSCG-928-J15]|nr:hypothetical protein [Tyzzerella sp. OttesenSCG-928-J15]
MKKIFKKTVLFAVVAIMFSIPVYAKSELSESKAEQENGDKHLMIYSDFNENKVMKDKINDDKEVLSGALFINLDRRNINSSTVTLGTPFNLINTDTYYVPVISDNEIVTYIEYNKHPKSGEYLISIGEHFGKELSDLENNTLYQMQALENGEVVAISETEEIIRQSSYLDFGTDIDCTDIGMEFKNYNELKYVNIYEPIAEIRLNSNTIERGIFNSQYKYIKQGHNTCWAACMASIINVLNNENYNSSDITSIVGHNSGAVLQTQVLPWYKNNFDVQYAEYERNNRCAYSFYRVPLQLGSAFHQSMAHWSPSIDNHSVVIMGYNYTRNNNVYTSQLITIMDPDANKGGYFDCTWSDTTNTFMHKQYDSQ